jgi:hypothetical protein
VEYGVAGIAKALVCGGSVMTHRAALVERQRNNSSQVYMEVRNGRLQGDRIFAKVEFVRICVEYYVLSLVTLGL